MSRTAAGAAGMVIGFVMVFAVSSIVRVGQAPGVVELVDGERAQPRRPGGTTPRCVTAAGITRDCVIAEQVFTRPIVIGNTVVGLGGSRVAGFDADTLEEKWVAASSYSSGPQQVADGLVLITDNTRVVALDANTGAIVWDAPGADTVWASPGADLVLLVDRTTLTAIDPRDGTSLWAEDARLGDRVALTDAGVLVTDGNDETEDVVLAVADGTVVDIRVVTTAEVDALQRSEDVPDVRLLNDVAFIDLPGGSSLQLPVDPDSPLVDQPPQATLSGDEVLVAWWDRVDVHDRPTGTLLWTFPALAPVVLSGEPLLVFGNGLIYRIDGDTMQP